MTNLRILLLATTALTVTQLATSASNAQTAPLVVAQAREERGPRAPKGSAEGRPAVRAAPPRSGALRRHRRPLLPRRVQPRRPHRPLRLRLRVQRRRLRHRLRRLLRVRRRLRRLPRLRLRVRHHPRLLRRHRLLRRRPRQHLRRLRGCTFASPRHRRLLRRQPRAPRQPAAPTQPAALDDCTTAAASAGGAKQPPAPATTPAPCTTAPPTGRASATRRKPDGTTAASRRAGHAASASGSPAASRRRSADTPGDACNAAGCGRTDNAAAAGAPTRRLPWRARRTAGAPRSAAPTAVPGGPNSAPPPDRVQNAPPTVAPAFRRAPQVTTPLPAAPSLAAAALRPIASGAVAPGPRRLDEFRGRAT